MLVCVSVCVCAHMCVGVRVYTQLRYIMRYCVVLCIAMKCCVFVIYFRCLVCGDVVCFVMSYVVVYGGDVWYCCMICCH